MRLLQNSNPPVGRKVVTPGRRDNNDEVRCPCSRVVGERDRGGLKPGRSGRRKATPSGGGGGRERAVGYTFEYINVCNSPSLCWSGRRPSCPVGIDRGDRQARETCHAMAGTSDHPLCSSCYLRH